MSSSPSPTVADAAPEFYRGWRQTLWAMVAVQFIMSLSVTVIAPILPLFLPDIGVHEAAAIDVWAGVLNSASFLLSAMLAPVWGVLSDRYGRKLMVLRASIGISTVYCIISLVTSPWQLLGLTMLAGCFGGFSVSAVSLVASQVPEQRLGYALGWLSTAQMVGGLMGPVAAGTVADLAGGYRVVFLFTGGLAALAALGAARFVHEQRQAGRGPRGGWRRQVAVLATARGLPVLLTVLLMAQVGVRSVVPVITLFVADLTGPVAALATLAGFAASVTGIADVIASPFLGRRSDTLGYRRVLLISLTGAALCTLPMAWAGSYQVFLAERFAVGLFIGGILPTTNALIARSVQASDRGAVFGASATASLLGAFLGPLMGGSVAGAFGLRLVFVATGLLFLATLGWVFVAVRDPPKLASPGAAPGA
jgi:DHA1 family multidrug resistance protein-like MFS transporter